jgi:hypothetical protein
VLRIGEVGFERIGRRAYSRVVARKQATLFREDFNRSKEDLRRGGETGDLLAAWAHRLEVSRATADRLRKGTYHPRDLGYHLHKIGKSLDDIEPTPDEYNRAVLAETVAAALMARGVRPPGNLSLTEVEIRRIEALVRHLSVPRVVLENPIQWKNWFANTLRDAERILAESSVPHIPTDNIDASQSLTATADWKAAMPFLRLWQLVAFVVTWHELSNWSSAQAAAGKDLKRRRRQLARLYQRRRQLVEDRRKIEEECRQLDLQLEIIEHYLDHVENDEWNPGVDEYVKLASLFRSGYVYMCAFWSLSLAMDNLYMRSLQGRDVSADSRALLDELNNLLAVHANEIEPLFQGLDSRAPTVMAEFKQSICEIVWSIMFQLEKK